jgi:hypothetical protein
MTEYLVAARAAIIIWANLAVMPAEILFEAIEAELERRGRRGRRLASFRQNSTRGARDDRTH